MKVVCYQGLAEVLVSEYLETIELRHDLFVVRSTKRDVVVRQTGNMEIGRDRKTVSDFFVDARNLRCIKKNKDFEALHFNPLSAESLETFRTFPFMIAIKDPDVEAELQTKDFFDAFASERMTLENVVNVDCSSHMLSDHEGKPLPVAVVCDYLNGYYDDSRYDLAKAAAHLLTRKDVILFGRDRNRGTWSEGELRLAKDAEDALQDIPYYNVSSRRQTDIIFFWTPSLEDYRKVCVKVGPRLNIHKAIFDLDVLGLRAAGAALCDDYFQCRRGDEDD